MIFDDKQNKRLLEALERCLMVDSQGILVPDVEVANLPRKFMEVGGSEKTKYALGNLYADDGKKTLKAKGFKSTRVLSIEGSPAFHFQGHNVVSSGDATMLAYAATQAVHRTWPTGFDKARGLELARGQHFLCSRLDTPLLLRVPDGIARAALINAMALAAVLAGIDTLFYFGESVYFDPGDQFAALKAYDKVAQLNASKRRSLPNDDAASSQLLDLARWTLRMEGVFRGKYLKHRFGGMYPEFQWLSRGELAQMMMELLNRFDFRRKLRRPMNEDELYAIPKYRHVVMYWQHGHDVLKMMNNNRTEYLRARSYLSKIGINIESVPPAVLDSEFDLGDLLRPENFVEVPIEIASNPKLLFSLDLASEMARLRD